MNMRPTTTLLCALLVLVAVCAVGVAVQAETDKPPARVLTSFYRDVAAGNIETVLQRVRPEDRRAANDVLKHLAPVLREQFGNLEDVEAEVAEQEGDYAVVDVRVLWEIGGEQVNRHELVHVDGAWLLKMEPWSGEVLSEPEGPPEPLHLVNRQAVNPYNVIHVPRPNPDTENVPLRTSFFVIVATEDSADRVDPYSVSIQLEPEGGAAFPVLEEGQTFSGGYSGELFEVDDNRYGRGLAIYVDSETALAPNTAYAVTVTAQSVRGERLPEEEQTWSFTTEPEPALRTVGYTLDLEDGPDVVWDGAFFNALAKSAFTTSAPHRLPHYDLIAEAQEEFPKAWTLQRDAYLAGFEHQPQMMKSFPNIVREKETRRITDIQRDEDGAAELHVEDFFGHEQYGIESNRSLSADYHEGDEILIADGVNSVRAHVIDADSEAGVVRVTAFEDPPEGWKLEYARPLPQEEDPNAPGLFPPGGTYLRKFDPVGTPKYYWGRVNHEWDIVHREYGRRVIPRFASAIGCTSIDGGPGTTAKCLVQHHEVTREITSHLIERYGPATLEWPWVVFNEPDLTALYWRNRDWDELQRFYDYTSDAVLRAFEDHGYDSDKVQVGGLELGAIFGTRGLRLDDFLYHCSPNVDSEEAVTYNAAYADPRLDGKRSERVERLCGENDGMGAPLDFLSVHSYDASDTAAAKLIRSKERALEIDAAYYETLPVVSHETVPTWRPILDPGAAGMYLGNGYFTSWMADFQARLLAQAAEDGRYAHGGELVLMHWPGIVWNFNAMNDTVRRIRLEDRNEVIPKPSFHFVNLLSTLSGGYWVFPMEEIGGHAVSGFATLTDEDLRIVVYAHHHEDTASHSDAEFKIELGLEGLDGNQVAVEEHRFDRKHNSYHESARNYRQEPGAERNRVYTEAEFKEIQEQTKMRVTASSSHPVKSGALQLPVTVAANGTNLVIVKLLED